ncbi:MAG: ribosome maturation factor RimM [Lachnospiraceae bacterium]|nr:ribosome maturation factor RimM [Lachnospiraceae bacterium]
MEQLLQVGIISSTHGVRGEVKVFPTTDDVKRFKKLKDVLVDTGKEKKPLQIESVKFFKQFAILKFKGYDTLDDIVVYKGKSLLVERKNAVRLNKDEYFIADLIGLSVENEDKSFTGMLADVIETGANDVYIVKTAEGKDVLIPAIKDCILEVDVEAGFMKVHLLDGLLD